MALRETLLQICADAHCKPSISFEYSYRLVYNMCLRKQHAEVHACLVEIIELIYGTERADGCYAIVNDVSMYYNATCTYNALPTFAAMYNDYRPKPAQFNTPPSTP